MTSTNSKSGLFGRLTRGRSERLTDRQLADIISDSDPRLRGRLSREEYPSTLSSFLLFGGPNSR